MAIRYPVTVRPLSADEGGGFLCEVPDLPGCMADGKTAAQAYAAVEDAIAAWIETAKAMGRQVPQPSAAASYSGKWLVRAPRRLHMALAERAKSEGVSLNALTVTLLAGAVGEPLQPAGARNRAKAKRPSRSRRSAALENNPRFAHRVAKARANE
jgi:predicted RNase H-like HicB family nuclease